MILIKVPDARREVLHILTSQMLERRPDTGQAIGGIRHLMAHYQQTYELSTRDLVFYAPGRRRMVSWLHPGPRQRAASGRGGGLRLCAAAH